MPKYVTDPQIEALREVIVAKLNAHNALIATADAEIGQLASLTTVDKSSLVAAVNEVLAAAVAAQSTASAAAVIDDTSTSTAAWSAAKIMSEIVAQVTATVDAAPDALNTLNELAAALGDDPNFAATVSAALALRVRVDAVQSFSDAQQTQGRENIGVLTSTTDFAGLMTAALN